MVKLVQKFRKDAEMVLKIFVKRSIKDQFKYQFQFKRPIFMKFREINSLKINGQT